MEFGTVMKYIFITVLILAGYYVVSQTTIKSRREWFPDLGSGSSSSSNDTPAVAAKKSSDVLTDKVKSMVGVLQMHDNRNHYEGSLELMDGWLQAKIISSINALSAQMIADSKDQSSMMSPPSDKTVTLMNSLITMTNFHTTVVPSALKIVDNA